ncbi:protein of unknown function [Cupriavidus taiwanensis]|uniref:Uncharacterized protein n=1 Tax=Cupriavidus taiwanensis TaxID=164546 RepID=A0A9Q7URS2_9BURK|nr:protein of unknown function [Cupriavidus taiwanensis]
MSHAGARLRQRLGGGVAVRARLAGDGDRLFCAGGGVGAARARAGRGGGAAGRLLCLHAAAAVRADLRARLPVRAAAGAARGLWHPRGRAAAAGRAAGWLLLPGREPRRTAVRDAGDGARCAARAGLRAHRGPALGRAAAGVPGAGALADMAPARRLNPPGIRLVAQAVPRVAHSRQRGIFFARAGLRRYNPRFDSATTAGPAALPASPGQRQAPRYAAPTDELDSGPPCATRALPPGIRFFATRAPSA